MYNNTISELFDYSNLKNDEQLRRVSLIRIILLTCVAGLIYSAIYMFVLDMWDVANVVITYIFLSTTNVTVYYFIRKYNVFRVLQLILIVLLPIITQVFIGGFIASSAVGLSAVLAPIGALLFYNIKIARLIFVLFVILLTCAGIYEYLYLPEEFSVSRKTIILFFVIVISATSFTIYWLVESIVRENKRITSQLLEANIQLQKKATEIEEQNDYLSKQYREILNQREVLEKLALDNDKN